MQINVYNQLAGFYETIWTNPKMKSQHCALYWFLVNQANRLRWPEWFSVPRDIAMNGSKINKRETYYKTITVLVELKLIEYIKSTNQHEAPHFKIIRLSRKGDKQGTGTGTSRGSSRGLAGEPYKDNNTLKHKDCTSCIFFNPEIAGYGYCGEDYINTATNSICERYNNGL